MKTIKYKGNLYVESKLGKGLGTPGGQLTKPTVSAPQQSKGNSKAMPVPNSPQAKYLKGKGK
jgi:hypothetical protein